MSVNRYSISFFGRPRVSRCGQWVKFEDFEYERESGLSLSKSLELSDQTKKFLSDRNTAINRSLARLKIKLFALIVTLIITTGLNYVLLSGIFHG